MDRYIKNVDWFLKISLILAGLWAFLTAPRVNDQWIVFLLTMATIALVYLPQPAFKRFGIKLPSSFHLTITIFIWLSVTLGSTYNFYLKFWWWDVVLHTSSGVLLGLMGVIVFSIIRKKYKISLDPFIISFFSFFFAVGCGAIWEIYEFAVDYWFGFAMQDGGSLWDTMWDLISDSLGALFTVFLTYFSIKKENSRMHNIAEIED